MDSLRRIPSTMSEDMDSHIFAKSVVTQLFLRQNSKDTRNYPLAPWTKRPRFWSEGKVKPTTGHCPMGIVKLQSRNTSAINVIIAQTILAMLEFMLELYMNVS